jgi:TolA-binding protein
MSIRKTVEDNIVVFLLGAVVTGFGAGWAAYVSIQNASGRVSISNDHLKQLEDNIKQLEDDIKQSKDQVKHLQDEAILNSDPMSKMQQLESERNDLQKELQENRPKGQNFISNVTLFPATPSVLKTHENIIVKFDYVFAKGEKGGIFAVPDCDDASGKKADSFVETDCNSAYEPSSVLEGTGTTSRYIESLTAGKINAIEIDMISEKSGKNLYRMRIPVKYIYR